MRRHDWCWKPVLDLIGEWPPAFSLQGWGDAEHAPVTIETAVRHEDVAVGIAPQEIAEGLDGHDGDR